MKSKDKKTKSDLETNTDLETKSEIPDQLRKVDLSESLGLIKKEYWNKYGISKHYLKFDDSYKRQIESTDSDGNEIMIFAETQDDPLPQECPYYENLPKHEIEKFKLYNK